MNYDVNLLERNVDGSISSNTGRMVTEIQMNSDGSRGTHRVYPSNRYHTPVARHSAIGDVTKTVVVSVASAVITSMLMGKR